VRYSEIIRDHFKIGLTPFQLELVDAHFLAAAHHRQRSFEGAPSKQWHACLFAQHVGALFRLISSGDFSHATDPNGLDTPDFWLPPTELLIIEANVPTIESCLPDSGLFHGFPPDRRYKVGVAHPHDWALLDPTSVGASRQILLAG
jgi:hypothetical protein